MSTQYAGGTIVNATMASPLGTRAELAQWIRDQLVNAGWSSSGSATDYQLTSALTPQNLQCRVRCYDPGSGSCARLKWSNPGGTKTQAGDLFLLPAAAKSWRIIANKYQTFVFTPTPSVAREFACGGSPYLPSFLNGVITEAIWGHGNALTDTAATAVKSFRTEGHAEAGGTNAPNQFCLCNGQAWDNANVGGGIGDQQLLVGNSNALASVATGYRWHDDSLTVNDPIISWGLTGKTVEAKHRGQLWDAIWLSGDFLADTTISFDGRTFFAVTDQNAGSGGVTGKGTLFLAVP